MTKYCYLNGKILLLSKAHISPYDIGLLRGFGIYEALKTYNRKPFMLKEHLARFKNSAKTLSLTIPATDAEIASAMHELVAKSIPKGKEATFRIILTGGTAIHGIEYDRKYPTFYILVEESQTFPAANYANGCSLTVFEEQRRFPESKTTNYVQAVILQEARKKAGAIEILYVSEGKVLEAASSNFFIVKNRRLVTAKARVLPGITKKVVIELSRPFFRIEEREVGVKEMREADEAFITSSFREIVPIVKIGNRKVGNGKVGEVTKEVMRLFRDFTATYDGD